MDSLIGFVVSSLGLSKEQQKLIVRSGWVLIVSIHIMWVCGWLAFAGFASPFARAEDVQTVRQVLKEDHIERLDAQILALREKQCEAATPEAKKTYGERLHELIQKYLQVSGNPPRVPACDEL